MAADPEARHLLAPRPHQGPAQGRRSVSRRRRNHRQADLKAQAKQVVLGLKTGMIEAAPDREIIALIAYLQRLGTDIKAAAVAQVTPTPTP
jgi:cbb3-type cytochrome oxidase cytochrome c subunit